MFGFAATAPRACIRADVVKIVIFSPHRDDAAFSVGLSIETWLEAGHTVHVLNCFTQSAYAPFSDADSLHPNDRVSFVSAVRKREDTVWAKLLGGKLLITDLDLLDAPLRLACGADEVLSMPIRPGDRAVARIAGAVAKLARTASAAELALVLPLAIGGHIDHMVTRQAGLDMLAGSPLPIAFFEDLPYAARPGAMEGIGAEAESTGFAPKPSFASEPQTDGTAAAGRKRRMAEAYDSQIDSEVAGQIADFSRGYQGRERLWCNRAWRTSVLATAMDEPTA